MAFIDVREDGTDRLLFRYDPETEQVEVQRRGQRSRVSLRHLRAKPGLSSVRVAPTRIERAYSRSHQNVMSRAGPA